MSRASKAPSTEEVGRYYDQMAGFYRAVLGENIHVGYWRSTDDASTNAEAQDRLTDMAIERVSVRVGQRLVDVGCGTGRPAVRLAQATGASVVGVTVSAAQVAAFNARAADAGVGAIVEARVADAMSLPFDDASMDGAWAIESLLHMPDRAVVLKEIHRVLKPGGHFVLTDVTEDVSLSDSERTLFFGGFLLSSLLTREEYGPLVEAAGFRVIESLDISENTRRTMDVADVTLRKNRAHLESMYGSAFVAQVMDTWPLMAAIQRDKLGYLILSAVRD